MRMRDDMFDPTELLRVPIPARPRELPVRIGVSGNDGAHTRELCAGIATALAEWYATAEPSGEVELLWRADSFDAHESSATALALVERGCRVVIGHLSSSAALPAAAVYARENVAFLAPGTTHPALTQRGYRNVLRFCGRDDTLAERIAELVVNRGWTRPLLAYEDIVYGRELGALVGRALSRRGRPAGTPLAFARASRNAPRSRLDLDPYCDVVIFAGRYQCANELMSALADSGPRHAAVVLGDDAFIPGLLNHDAVRGPETYVVSTPTPSADPRYERFAEAYRARARAMPGAYSLTSYAAADLALRSLDALAHGGCAVFLDEVRALAAARRTPLGELRFTPDGDVERFAWQVYSVRGSRFTPVEHLAEV